MILNKVKYHINTVYLLNIGVRLKRNQYKMSPSFKWMTKTLHGPHLENKINIKDRHDNHAIEILESLMPHITKLLKMKCFNALTLPIRVLLNNNHHLFMFK